MELPSYFTDFLSEIRPQQDQLDVLRDAHLTLRERLKDDENLAPICISDFLQGSYRRSTAVRPLDDEQADVDVIVVTNLDPATVTPDQAFNHFVPFLNAHYKDQWTRQGRSICIELPEAKLDLVVTAAPSEAQKGIYLSASVRTDLGIDELKDWRLVASWPDPEDSSRFQRLEAAKKEAEWRAEPLMIPDRDAKEWQATNPLAQILWTWDKNKRCNGHYVNVVKAVKWWRRQHEQPKYPKSYPLEHLIGDCCSDSLSSVASGVTATLETIVTKYQSFADSGTVPFLRDHGVDQDVFRRITGEDFTAFHALVEEASKTAREALDAPTVGESAAAWHRLFGDPFPKGPETEDGGESGGGGKGGFTPRTAPTILPGGRFG
jgi:SMODS domain-containing protein